VALLAPAAACATAPTARPEAAAMNAEAAQPTPVRRAPLYYALQYARGPNWDPTKPLLEQPLLDPHVDYMQGLMEKGVLLYGGPYTDDTGGMAIVRVGSFEEAQAIVAADPAVRNGLFAPTIKAWRTAFNAVER
jgi:uncharacterized protein YciI